MVLFMILGIIHSYPSFNQSGFMEKGTIAIDIDGTLTSNPIKVEKQAIDLLIQADRKGWQLIFLTGRTFAFSEEVFKQIPLSFYGVCQNGALALTYPEKKILRRKYLNNQSVIDISSILLKENVLFVLESGMENKDIIYYFPNLEDLNYLKHRQSISPEIWQEISSLEAIAKRDFPAIKYFGAKDKIEAIAKKLYSTFPEKLAITIVLDPFRKEGGYLALVTDIQATKEHSLDFLFHHYNFKKPLIVAGDDYNDVEMLKRADIKIVMNTAPKDILALADIIAPAAKNQGIVRALKEVIWMDG